jgi:archaemetzincin
MIHVITLEAFDEDEVRHVCRSLFAAYGVGSEHAAELPVPEGARAGKALDPVKLLEGLTPPKTFADDKVIYLVKAPLVPRPSTAGPLPTHGYALYGASRAVASSADAVPPPGAAEPEQARLDAFAKLAVHQIGHLWSLHHCLDPRCSMTLPWLAGYFQNASPGLCPFCRDKSERRMKNPPA